MITLNQDVDKPHKVVIEKPIISGYPKWANYIRGVMANYLGVAPSFQAVITTSVPTGGGLSSSAALEVATYIFMDALGGPTHIMYVVINKKKLRYDYYILF